MQITFLEMVWKGMVFFPCIGEKWQFKTLQNLEIDLPPTQK